MLDIQITRLIAAAIVAVLLGWACYVTAFVKHKNEKADKMNKAQLENAIIFPNEKIDEAKTSSWYVGYRLALIGLIIVAAVVGWAAAYFVSEEYEISWVEDCLVAGIGALVGGLVLDKYIIHPIADGKFFEKVEDPLVDYFLQNGDLPSPEVKETVKKMSRKEKKKEMKEKTEEAPSVPAEEAADPIDELIGNLTFDEKIKVLQKLKKSI